MQYDINKQIAMKTAPVIQKVSMIVSSIPPQFDATGVHHQGDQKWKATDATTIKTNTWATINGNIFNYAFFTINIANKTTPIIIMWLPKSNHPSSSFFESTMRFHRFKLFFEFRWSLLFVQTYLVETYSQEKYKKSINRQITVTKVVYAVFIFFQSYI